ncbi:carboxypeptidase regulatory-like domain-containing protein [Dehalobacter sp. DCM]|uniref:4Fe-4S dicluster domain-containing protein n=1 Tax=Dehalobacter sp. DCM TaxID=2907827 RepID=UPI003081C9EF|nr:carboxypeptidase regulatory-like domain-containing protein [Dehalobacter sp. DCM]
MKVFVIDIARCNGCYNCQIVCKDEHVGNEWLPYAKPQPDIGHFWMKLNETVHGQVPKVNLEYRPLPCMHCDDPACIQQGDDTVYKRQDGLVIIDPEKAAGKKELVSACPYDKIFWNEELGIVQKCTGCAHLVDAGEIPRCVDACSTGALRFGEEEDFGDEIAAAEVLMPEKGLKPRVYYLNLPKLFIAGDVWDPAANEIIEGATIVLTAADGTQYTTESDDLGDFWFRKLNPGRYDIAVEAQEYKKSEKLGIELTESLNIGDFPLIK